MGSERPDPAFGQLLRGYRLAAALTQEELAERSGLSARAIADMERGRTSRPYRHSVRVIADALSLSGLQRESLVQASRPVPDGISIPEAVAAAPVARQLPPAVSHFAGRDQEQAALTGLLEAARGDGGAVVISAIAGTAGVGKTGLATHWAHQVADLFPDGQLYVNLRGYDPGPPVSPADALAAFLRALGVPGRDIPAEAGELATRFRTLVAGKRILVLLDNAKDAGQVRPLLPGTAGCLVLVTSRDSLAGLVARDGARRIELDVLRLEDAVSLLRELIGPRVDADPGAAEALATLCCRLPLALRVAAELAVARPGVCLTDLAADLSDQRQRLDLLDAGGDQATAVRTVFSWSEQQLDPADALTFWLLGLHPGPDADAHAVAALAGTMSQEATRRLDRLARAHLIQPTAPGRYGMHDLLRRYAASRAAAAITTEERAEAGARLLDYLQDAAIQAEALCQREIRSTAIARYRSSRNVAADYASSDAALTWLRAERPVLLACLDQAEAAGQHARVVALTAGLAHLLHSDGPRAEARTRHAAAVHAAQELGDRLSEAHAMLCLGDALRRTGQHAAVMQACHRSGEIFRDLGDDLGLASTLAMLGLDQLAAGDSRATRTLSEARGIFRDLDDGLGIAGTLLSIAESDRLSGNFAGAAAAAAEAVTISGDLGDQAGRAEGLLRMGLAQSVTDSYPAAAQSFAEALSIFQAGGDRTGQAFALQLLGEAQSVSGDHDAALRNLVQSRETFRSLGTGSRGEAVTLLRLGEARCAVGDYDGAAPHLAEALAIFGEFGEPVSQAGVLIAQSNVWRMTGDYRAAEQALADALAIGRDHDVTGIEAEALNTTGALRQSQGDLADAEHLHQEALQRARKIAMPLEEGRALAGLARCALSGGDRTRAHDLLRQAHAVLAPTGAAEAQQIASELHDLSAVTA